MHIDLKKMKKIDTYRIHVRMIHVIQHDACNNDSNFATANTDGLLKLHNNELNKIH